MAATGSGGGAASPSYAVTAACYIWTNANSTGCAHSSHGMVPRRCSSAGSSPSCARGPPSSLAPARCPTECSCSTTRSAASRGRCSSARSATCSGATSRRSSATSAKSASRSCCSSRSSRCSCSCGGALTCPRRRSGPAPNGRGPPAAVPGSPRVCKRATRERGRSSSRASPQALSLGCI